MKQKKRLLVLLCPQCSGELHEVKIHKKTELFCNNCGASIVKVIKIRETQKPESKSKAAQLRKRKWQERES
jgi:DNA-directed RNA polymerase subunit M/transcription elongation factor TFIIS